MLPFGIPKMPRDLDIGSDPLSSVALITVCLVGNRFHFSFVVTVITTVPAALNAASAVDYSLVPLPCR